LKRRKEKRNNVNEDKRMTRYLERNISKGNVIDLLGQWFYQLGLVQNNECITDIELVQGDKDFRIKLTIKKELGVELVEHYGKRLYEGSSVGGQTRTGETS
jgi:hypothetical protein